MEPEPGRGHPAGRCSSGRVSCRAAAGPEGGEGAGAPWTGGPGSPARAPWRSLSGRGKTRAVRSAAVSCQVRQDFPGVSVNSAALCGFLLGQRFHVWVKQTGSEVALRWQTGSRLQFCCGSDSMTSHVPRHPPPPALVGLRGQVCSTRSPGRPGLLTESKAAQPRGRGWPPPLPVKPPPRRLGGGPCLLCLRL